jgi:hypothetical protein
MALMGESGGVLYMVIYTADEVVIHVAASTDYATQGLSGNFNSVPGDEDAVHHVSAK